MAQVAPGSGPGAAVVELSCGARVLLEFAATCFRSCLDPDMRDVAFPDERGLRRLDNFWTGKIPALVGHKGTYSFSGLYDWLFRGYSSLAHPSEVGLFRVTDTLGGHVRIRTERREPDRSGPYGMATVLFGLALFVAGKSIGWPDVQKVHALFERYPVIEASRAHRRGWLDALLGRFRRS